MFTTKYNPFTGQLDLVGITSDGSTVAPDTVTSESIVDGSILTNDLNVSTIERFDFNNVIRVDPTLTANISGVSYLTLQEAVAYAEANATISNTLLIELTTSLTLDSKITLTNPYVGIKGKGSYNIVVTVDDSLAGDNIFELNYNSVVRTAPIGNFQIKGSATLKSTADTVAVNVLGQGIYYINTLVLEDFNTGLKCDRTSGSVQVVLIEDNITVRNCVTGNYLDRTSITYAKLVSVDCTTNVNVQTNGNVTIESGSLSGFQNTQTDIGLDTTGSPSVTLNGIEFSNLLTGAILDTPDIIFNSCNFEDDTTTHAIVNGAANLRSLGTRINTEKVTFNAVLNSFDGNYVDYAAGDEAFAVLNKLNVGLPNAPRETALGGGNSYNVAALFYSFNGSTYTNVKPELTEIGGTSYTFPNNNVNTALYISNLYLLPFLGIKVELLTNAVLGGGDIVFEYWDGTSWVEFNHMLTRSSGNYIPYANDKFEVAASGGIQARFDERIQNDWATNDPASLGFSSYWMRIRIASAITTSPEFDKIKIHPSRAEFNEDGYPEKFGNARYIAKFPITYGAFQAAAQSPSNADIYLSDTLFAGRAENNFQDNTTDSTGVALIVPYDVDTSCPIKVRINSQGESSTQSGNILWEVSWGQASEGDDIYIGTQGPATADTQQSVQILQAVTSENYYRKTATSTFNIEIPSVITQVSGGVGGDLLFITIRRLANDALDTYEADITVNDISFEYTSWRSGGHVLAQ